MLHIKCGVSEFAFETPYMMCAMGDWGDLKPLFSFESPTPRLYEKCKMFALCPIDTIVYHKNSSENKFLPFL